MKKIIGKDSRVHYGVYDEPVLFNHKDFVRCNLFGKKLSFPFWRNKPSGFNFIGLQSGDIFAGIGAVQLGYAANLFGFLYDYKKGLLFDRTIVRPSSRLVFPADPDEHVISYHALSDRVHIKKAHRMNLLEFDCMFGRKLHIKGGFLYGLREKPLRVLNPSCGDPMRFTFTEKCPLTKPVSLSVSYDGIELIPDYTKVRAIYDWSGGFFNRYTHWFWSAFSGQSGKISIGANFAAMVNETFYPENAYWINGKRIRVPQVIFDFNMHKPYESPWKIFTEDGRVDLTFTPCGVRGKRSNMLFIKLSFSQYPGEYSGTLKDAAGKKIAVKGMRGIAEVHLSKW